MLKILNLASSCLVSSALIASLCSAARIAAAEVSQSSAVVDAPVCYMLSADGSLLNLDRICGKNADAPTPAQRVSSSNLSPETNLGELDIHGRGENAPPCFGLDDQGRVCPSSK